MEWIQTEFWQLVFFNDSLKKMFFPFSCTWGIWPLGKGIQLMFNITYIALLIWLNKVYNCINTSGSSRYQTSRDSTIMWIFLFKYLSNSGPVSPFAKYSVSIFHMQILLWVICLFGKLDCTCNMWDWVKNDKQTSTKHIILTKPASEN